MSWLYRGVIDRARMTAWPTAKDERQTDLTTVSGRNNRGDNNV